MHEFVFPTVAKTGEPAWLSVTARESRLPATVSVRLSLPRRTLVVAQGNNRAELPHSSDEETGLPIAQFRAVMN